MFVIVARFALSCADNLIGESLAVGVAVHGHEAHQLQQAGIDPAADTGMLKPNLLDHSFFQLPHLNAIAKVGDVAWIGIGINRAANQSQARGLRLGGGGREIGCCNKRNWSGLAHSDDMGV